MKKTVVIFIDVLAAKNKLQVSAIKKGGFNSVFFVYKYNEASNNFLGSDDCQILLQKKWILHLLQVYRFLKKNKNTTHHLEIYPGSAFSFLYVMLGKVLKIKTVCAERGDLLYFNKEGYSKVVRFSMRFCYRHCSITWYRELYMESVLKKIGARKLFFLHNAIKVESPTGVTTGNSNSGKDIMFLWLNRVIPQRRYDWFLNVLKKSVFVATRNYMVGFISNGKYEDEQEFIKLNKPDNLTIEEYTNTPAEYFKRAKFFVLPADVVFANHALLEAMSYGVVPLVSDQPGSRLIIENGKNGFIFQHNEEEFEKTMLYAYNMDDIQYKQISESAKIKIVTDFSEEKYVQGIEQLYKEIESLAV